MKDANLIDIFGLSGDPASDAQVDELLARLEFEGATNLLDANPGEGYLQGPPVRGSHTQVLSALRARSTRNKELQN